MQMKSIAKIIFCSLSISTIAHAADPTPSSSDQSPSQQIAQLNTTIQNQLKALQAQQQQQITTLNSQLQAQLKQVQTDLQTQIQTANTQTQNQMKEIQTNLQQQIAQVQGQIKH
jgi:DNA anti-recombination protein RmuC